MKLSVIMNGGTFQEESSEDSSEKSSRRKNSRIYDPEISIVNSRVNPSMQWDNCILAPFIISNLVKSGDSQANRL